MFSWILSAELAIVAATRRALMFAALSLIFLSGHAHAQPMPPRLYTVSPTGVDLATGSFTTSVKDLSIGPLSLERSYVTADRPGNWTSNNYFGPGWTHNFDIYARQDYFNGEATSLVGIGRSVYRFSGWPPSTYPEMDELGTNLTSVGGAMVFTDRDGTVYRFLSGTGMVKVSTITYPDGTTLTFNYASGLPKTIVSNRGYALVFDYSSTRVISACGYNLAATNVTIATTCSGAALRVNYGYTSTRLTSVTDVLNNVASYSYDANGFLSCLTDPGTTTCRITNTNTGNVYTGQPNVTAQVTADGATWGFECDCGAYAIAVPDDPYPQEGSRVTEPNGAISDMIFVRGSPAYYKNEIGKVYKPTYVGRTLYSIVSPEGNTANYSYNGNLVESKASFVAKSGSGLANIDSSTKTFPASCTNPALCNLPLSITDANGNRTDYGYASWGGMTSELQPAPSALAARPLRLNTYVQKYAYVKNAGGALVAAASPVWMPDTETVCQTYAGSSALTCDPAAPITVTSFEYGANGIADNLLPRGRVVSSGGVSLRTCFGYDWKGRKISETSPRAGLASCS
ncbi:MAG: RHS repeat protein [Sphingomonas sp.]|uniref:RHS repeat domain-containing protein n=1 Tax=Sphingomonas sp. TaxID=28214 RepID=UPI0025FE168E|nr:RHS repeat domain-containing protein [Sphingomonas sp.]MBQ1497681.1 RHS repeat protein [Sphingomonas sp.]MBQ8102771.1 RHS repeat protein [Afipia sp.]